MEIVELNHSVAITDWEELSHFSAINEAVEYLCIQPLILLYLKIFFIPPFFLLGTNLKESVAKERAWHCPF